jgi:phosphatidylglycerophosphatase A
MKQGVLKYISWLCRYIATLGPVGYLPMPGTMGTLCAIPLVIGLRKIQATLGFFDEAILVGLCVFVTVWIIDQALNYIDGYDPSEVVLDEVIGFVVTMMFFPLQIKYIILGFIYFRFFDITKPLGINSLQRIHGGWGIVLDDLAAALVARLALHITFTFLL